MRRPDLISVHMRGSRRLVVKRTKQGQGGTYYAPAGYVGIGTTAEATMNGLIYLVIMFILSFLGLR
jgi:ADP-ribose pyrophosphatase YjhB (NUDIX family)